MKAAIFCSLLLMAGVSSFAQSAKYISVKDSLPKYANIVAVLLTGKEDVLAPVLAEFIWAPDGKSEWLLASSTPWDRQNVSQGGVKVDVAYWYPLPMEEVHRTTAKK